MTCHDHPHQGGESYELVIVATPDDDAPPVVRLRHVLKALLRQYGFRCTGVKETTPYPGTPTGSPAGTSAAEATGEGATEGRDAV
jgi:hypothetical protein